MEKININEIRKLVKEIITEDHIQSDNGRLNFIKKNLNKLSDTELKSVSDGIKRLYNKVEKYIGHYEKKDK